MSRNLPLLQYVMHGKHTWGTRVFDDGHVDDYRDQDVSFANDAFVARPVPLAWRPRASLAQADVDALSAALRASDFFGLPGRLEPTGKVSDAATTVWQAHLGHQQHEVTAVGDAQARHPTLEHLRTTLEDLVATALSEAEAS